MADVNELQAREHESHLPETNINFHINFRHGEGEAEPAERYRTQRFLVTTLTLCDRRTQNIYPEVELECLLQNASILFLRGKSLKG